MNESHELKPPHKCVAIGRVTRMAEGRDWWVGKLTEKVPGWEHETHCLHMKTPLKDVIFLLNDGDLGQLAVLLACCQGSPISERWVETQMPAAIAAADRKNGGIQCDATKGPCACGAWH